MPITIDVHHYLHFDTGQLSGIERALAALTEKGNQIMATVTEVGVKLDALLAAQATVGSEVSEAVVVLQEVKAALDAAIATGATPAQLQDIADKLDAATTGLVGSAATLDAAAKAADITP